MTLFQNMRRGLLPARLTVDEIYDLTASGALAENERLELIEGEIVPMAAAKANWHSIMEGKLNWALVKQLPDKLRVYPAPSLTLSDDTLLEPDLVVVPLGAKMRELRGPDMLLVIEVADSSLSYDLHVKAPLYSAHGVREYWVVDAVRQTIRTHRAPGPDGYADVEEYEAHDRVEALLLPGVTIRLDTLG
ncbi:Uma2 family endonuclease [Sphingomonas sp.]|uniref:Uma2 family endonuclease n=1 Tax=Sphingomonas sp. TaxID=28214 RepID=UPI001B040A3D|nr:Uma2 family endonuclease [Sphingomonas sp.]MBO9715015.1 Uma2 family endonuclease [Sphingomonas sp.]